MPKLWPTWCVLAALVLCAAPSAAAPQAHLLRVDPRSAVEDDAPVLTTVIELLQHKSLSDLSAQCATLTVDEALACMSSKLDQPRALYEPFKFPEQNANLLVTVDGRDQPAELLSVEKWGASKQTKGVGTAWLIMIDASGQMGSRFAEAKRVAKSFIDRMGQWDIVDVMFFNDHSIVEHSKWTAKRGLASNFVDGVKSTFPKQGRTKSVMDIVQKGVTDGFSELGNVGKSVDVPLHQTLVLLTDANAGSDFNSTATGALKLREYLTKGRFPEDNTTMPKMPLPVISIWFPNKAQDEVFANARQFMENLANPEIGGAFFIVQGGEAAKGDAIAKSVNERFDLMNIVKWRVACLAPTVTQNFQLVFRDFEQPITGDVCTDCPLGQSPELWPLAIDYEQTEAYAKKNKIHPGGTVRVFGSFCWGTEISRAELYLLPKNQPAPQSLEGKTLEEAQQARATLVRSNMHGKAINGGDEFIEFEVPDNTKFLSGKDKSFTARMVVFDSRAGRTSPVTADKILTLPAEEKQLNLLLIGGATFGGVVVLLLLINLFRGGGRSRARAPAAAPAPRPVVAGSGHGGPNQGGPAHGGYPAAPVPAPAGAGGATAAAAPFVPMTGPAGGPAAGAGAEGSYGMGMDQAYAAGAAPAAALDASVSMGGGSVGGASMGGGPALVASQMSMEAAPSASAASRATLQGAPGTYPVMEGRDVKVGRDPGLCDICLTEPRVSGMHATLKFEGGQFFVRDEGSNNGTYINNGKIQSYAWMTVAPGGTLRFGPIEFTVRFE